MDWRISMRERRRLCRSLATQSICSRSLAPIGCAIAAVQRSDTGLRIQQTGDISASDAQSRTVGTDLHHVLPASMKLLGEWNWYLPAGLRQRWPALSVTVHSPALATAKEDLP
jgi:hypothetical protein